MLPILVIDLFCGIGGFSTGAIQAGANVILAVDMWNDAIVIHTKNHPNTTHWVEELGGDCNIFMEKMQQFLIKNYGARDAYHLHIHGSPPCQNLSSLNVNRDEEEGLRLVIWTLNLIKKMNPNSWTLEQVYNSKLKNLMNLHNGKLVQCKDYGVPQMRKRVIMGTINWNDVEKIEFIRPLDLFKNNNTRPDVDWCKYQFMASYGGGRDSIFHPLTEVSYTVTCSVVGRLYIKDEKRGVCINTEEALLLQTFPINYDLGNSTRSMKNKFIGNALPPALAQQMIKSIII